ncbi:SDR family NAD(P)-dependent oxidoreductase [Mycobacterium sp. WMMD1722]|uniref:SDR family NAD(P)-dependent oxidoreductase n=1 Tax=Mycobacterium sp. WMMD1722 TaxID=3404117 RepID=UPI003BF4B3FC
MTTSDEPPVAVVTGASRGAGLGIARALRMSGWRVYRTGRSVTDIGDGSIAVPLDHTDDVAVAEFFTRVEQDSGRLDLLVNNAAAVHEALSRPKPFWEKPIALADILDVGLRSAYVATYFAAPLLLSSARSLVVFTSSPGSVCYMHGPAYGAQKAGIDKMAADMAVDFRDSTVRTAAIWMGILLTEKLRRAFDADPAGLQAFSEHAETPELTGHVIDALFADPHLDELSGHTLITAELARRYRITDEGGRTPPSHRDTLGAPRVPSDVVVR